MPDDVYIDLEVTSDTSTLADRGIDDLQTRWPDWEPNDANLEVAIIEICASMVADAAVAAGQVPASVFVAFGTAFAGVPFSSGEYATVELTFTLTDTDGQTIPAGTEVDVDGFIFATDIEVVAAPGVAAVTTDATATEVGLAFNDLPGSTVRPISSLARVTSVAIVAPPTNGADEETVEDYLNRLVLKMQLRADTLVTLRDHELLALTHPPVDRVVAEHLGARNIRVTAIDAAGAALSTPVKDELIAEYAALRLVNVTVTMADPAFKAVNVTYTVKAYPGYDLVALAAAIDAELATILSPAAWGRPREYGDIRSARWYNEPRVRVNKLIDLIGNVQGVDYVSVLTLSASGVTPEVNGDLILPGNVPLPTPGTMTGTIT